MKWQILQMHWRARATAIVAIGVLCYFVISPLRSVAQTPAGLVAAYNFNAGAGSTVADLSGNNNTGSIVGAAWTTGGKYGSALSFNGSTSYVDLGNPAALQLTGSMTVEAWINAAANPADDGQIIAKSDNASGWQFKTSPDTGPHTFGLSVGRTSSARATRYSTTVRSLNTWYHVAGVYNSATGTLNLYVNGVLNNGSLVGTIPASQFNQSVNVNIGRRTGGYYFNGIIDELRVYNRALSASEIQTDMNTPVGGAPPPPDQTSPTISLSSPASGATVSGTTAVAAAAADNVGVAGVQFLLDNAPLGNEDTAAPWAVQWDTGSATIGVHSLSARARDSAGNTTTSSTISVNVTNPTLAQVGQWSSVTNWPLVPVHTALLPTGNVLAWSDYTQGQGTRVWNPATNTFTSVPINGINLFCAGQTLLADGRVFVVGGTGSNSDIGIRNGSIFNASTQTWTQSSQMFYPRYYPTSTMLPDGRILVQGGTINCPTCIADVPEIYDPVANIWSQLTSAAKAFRYYPHTFVLPDGRVLVTSADDSAQTTQVLDLNSMTWTTVDPRVLDAHSSAMYLPGKIIKAGTATDSDHPGLQASANTYVLDMTQSSPAWQTTAPMAFPRSYFTMTILPDGQVLATGGGTTTDPANFSTAVYEAEVWSPATQTWTTLARMQKPRLYHSTALLLPDGRVLVAGGGRQTGLNNPDSADQPNSELYSPPYLFKGPRPVISSAPSLIQYGATFSVATSDAARIGSASLIALGSVTHAFDENQRYVPLTFATNGNGLDVQAPTNSNLAPPGYYMLFLVDTNGVPSIASILRLPSPSNDSQPPTAPGGLTASSSPGSVNLSWAASIDNVAVTGYNVHRSTTAGFTPSVNNKIGLSSTTAYTDTSFSSAGTYYYLVTAQDAKGNTSNPSTEALAHVVLETTPPNVSMMAPADGTTVMGMAMIAASASDNVAVSSVQFLLDDINLGSPDTTSPYSFSWNTATASNGSHLLSAAARDSAGNAATAAQVSVFVDNQAPAGSIVINGGAAATNSSTVTLTLSAADNAGAVSQMRFSNSSSPSTFSAPEAYSTTKTWTLSGATGTSNVYVQFKDTVGNWSPSFTDTIVFDTTAPTVSSVSVSGVTQSSAMISWTTNEPATSQVDYGTTSAYGNTSVLDSTLVTSHQLTLNGLALQTTYNYRVRSKDAAGNEQVGNNGTFTTPSATDTAPPSVPANLVATSVSSSQVALSWTASTDNVAVSGYKVFRDGSQIGSTAQTSYSDSGLTSNTTYAYAVSAFDAADNTSAASSPLNVTTTSGPSTPILPVKASSNNRYLVDQNKVPFLLTGDTAHDLMGKLTVAEADIYFSNRKANKFNSVAIYAPCGAGVHCAANGTTIDGIAPWTSGTGPSTYDLATPNEAYFARLDTIIAHAASYGLLILLDPIETADFLVTLRNNGAAKAFNYGVYVGNRYKSFTNILWQHGEDFQTWSSSSTDNNLVAQVMAGVASVDSNHLQTVQLDYPRSYSNQDTSVMAPFLTWDMVYTYHETHDYVLQAYNSSPILPVLMGEANYEGENLRGAIPGGTGTEVLRRQEYWTLTSGASGQYFGNGTVNHFDNGWQSSLNSAGVTQLQYVTALFTGFQWWNLVPDQAHNVVTAGYGTFDGNNLNLLSSNYATTAWLTDGSLAIAYCPTVTTLTVAMNKFSGAVTARWFDPSRGTFQAISGSPFPNSGSRSFSTPGTNGDGDSDWVLVLEASLVPDTIAPTTPGSLTATAISSSQINLSWASSSDNVAIAGYRINRDGNQIATTTTTSFSDTGLSSGTNYTYQVRAFDAAGNVSQLSTAAGATTTTPDGNPPTVPTNLQFSNVTASSATITWTASTDTEGPISNYRIFRNATQVATTISTSFADGGLSAATTYSYAVAAVDSSGNVSAQSQVLNVTTTNAAPATPLFVQTNNAVPQTPQSSVSVRYMGAQTTGDTNILAIGWADTTTNIASVTDSKGNIYQLAVPTARGSGHSQAIYYAKNIVAANAGSNTVTVTFNVAARYPDIRITEYSGLDRSSPFDVGTSASGSGTTANSGSVTTRFAKELIFGAGETSGAFTSAGSTFTQRVITSPDGDIAEDKVVSTIGTYNATANGSNAGWLMQVAAFRAAGQ